MSIPADPNVKLNAEMCPKNRIEEIEHMKSISYLEAIGNLLYVSQISRPDISFAVNAISQFCNNPEKAHWNAVKRIFRYLKGPINLELTFLDKMHHC